jgi:hypothetical protein
MTSTEGKEGGSRQVDSQRVLKARRLTHELGRVDSLGELLRTVSLEVVDKVFRLLSDVTVVDRLTSTGEEEKSVESRKEHGGRLVDRAEDGLTVVL